MEAKVKPSLVITSSRRPSQLTNTFMKALSAILNSPIIRRGTSNLDHISILAKDARASGFLVVYTNKGNPSVIDLYYKYNGRFLLFGRIFLLGVYINRKFKGNFEWINLRLKGKSEGAKEVYDFLYDYFRYSNSIKDIKERESNYCLIEVNDLNAISAKKLSKYIEEKNFRPATIDVIDENGGALLLKMKIHHVWRSQQK